MNGDTESNQTETPATGPKRPRFTIDWKEVWRAIMARMTLTSLAIFLATTLTVFLLRAFLWSFAGSIYVNWVDQQPVRIAVAMPYTGEAKKSAEQIWKAVTQAQWDHCHSDPEWKRSCDPGLLSFYRADDGGDTIQARDTAKQLIADKPTIAVIGNLTSTVTEAALPTYCDAKNSIAIVMPVPTATHIVDDAAEMGCTAVLRLPPTNVEQGRASADLVEKLMEAGVTTPPKPTPENWVAVFRDQSNPEYSNDLGLDFEYALRTYDREYGTQLRVLLDTGIGGDIGGPIVTPEMRAFPVRVLFIAGMTSAVLQTLRQEKIIGWSPPITVLTDGAFSADLLATGRDVLNDNTYLVFPIDTARIDLRAVVSNLRLNPNEIAYASYGYDAAKLLMCAIDQLGKSQEKITRESIRKLIESWHNGPPIAGAFIVQNQYEFDKLGNNRNAIVALYRYNTTSGQFEPLGNNVGTGP